MAGTRRRRTVHDPGRVLRDLVVMLDDGGNCLSDLGALRYQPDLFEELDTRGAEAAPRFHSASARRYQDRGEARTDVAGRVELPLEQSFGKASGGRWRR